MPTLVRVMSRYLKKIESVASVEEAAKRMRDDRVGALLVEKNRELIGMVTEKDSVQKAVAGGQAFGKASIESILTIPINSIDTTQTLLDALKMMRDLGVRHLVVCDAGRVVGIVSLRDLLVYFGWIYEQIHAHD